MSEKNGYIGKVSGAGAQQVKAPLPIAQGKKPKIHKGKDLRAGK